MLQVPVPSQVTVRQSSIPGAGLGVFAKEMIPRGVKVGPYVGKMVPSSEVDEGVDTSYMWEVSCVWVHVSAAYVCEGGSSAQRVPGFAVSLSGAVCPCIAVVEVSCPCMDHISAWIATHMQHLVHAQVKLQHSDH